MILVKRSDPQLEIARRQVEIPTRLLNEVYYSCSKQAKLG